MTTFNVLMASHLGSKERYITIKWALESLRDQVKKPDSVWISYSYNLDLGPPDTTEWSEILGDIPCRFWPSRTKLSQFTHYARLFPHFTDHDTVIMFLDDDDLYRSDKISKVAVEFENDVTGCVGHTYVFFGDIFESNLTPPNMIQIIYPGHRSFRPCREYWALSFRASYLPEILKRWTSYCRICSVNGIPSYEVDLAFRSAVNSVIFKGNVKIDEPLMYMRKDGMKKDYGLNVTIDR